MAGRRRSRHGGRPMQRLARLARAQAAAEHRRADATDELEAFGIAYGRVRAAVAKAVKAGTHDSALRRIRDLTAALDAAADAIHPTRRR